MQKQTNTNILNIIKEHPLASIGILTGHAVAAVALNATGLLVPAALGVGLLNTYLYFKEQNMKTEQNSMQFTLTGYQRNIIRAVTDRLDRTNFDAPENQKYYRPVPSYDMPTIKRIIAGDNNMVSILAAANSLSGIENFENTVNDLVTCTKNKVLLPQPLEKETTLSDTSLSI